MLCFLARRGGILRCVGGVVLAYGFGYRIWTKRHRQITFQGEKQIEQVIFNAVNFGNGGDFGSRDINTALQGLGM